MARITLDNKLGLDTFYVDDNLPHIEINENYENMKEINKLIMACPAGLYDYEEGKVTFNFEGCLECGTCRVLSLGKVVKKWNHPRGSKGVAYRQG